MKDASKVVVWGKQSGAALVVATLGCWSASGCGDSADNTTSTTSTSAVSSGSGAGGSGGASPTGTMSILVVAPTNEYNNVAPPPVPNAAISVDLPGGEHREITAGADGRAVVTGIDWSLGNATVMAATDGRAVYGVTDVGPTTFASIPNVPLFTDPPDVVLYLFALNNGAPLTVSGAVSNKAAPADGLFLSGTHCTGSFEGLAATYTLPCTGGTAFTLLGREEAYVTTATSLDITTPGWFKLDAPAQASGTLTVDVDLTAATPVTTQSSTGHVTIPTGASAAFPGMSFTAFVSSYESDLGVALGAIKHRQTTASGFDFGIEWTSLPGQKPISEYIVYGSDGSGSRVSHDGVPVDGETIGPVILPAKLHLPFSLAKPVTIDTTESTAVVRLLVTNSDGTYQLILDSPPGTALVHPPTALTGSAKPTGSGFKGEILLLEHIDPLTDLYLSYSNTKVVSATLP